MADDAVEKKTLNEHPKQSSKTEEKKDIKKQRTQNCNNSKVKKGDKQQDKLAEDAQRISERQGGKRNGRGLSNKERAQTT